MGKLTAPRFTVPDSRPLGSASVRKKIDATDIVHNNGPVGWIVERALMVYRWIERFGRVLPHAVRVTMSMFGLVKMIASFTTLHPDCYLSLPV